MKELNQESLLCEHNLHMKAECLIVSKVISNTYK